MAIISTATLPGETIQHDFRGSAIPYGEVDSTSTSTAYTVTVPGVVELVDGTTVFLKNGVVTSASGFTLNVNGLGAKPCYNNMATGNDITPTAPTRDTTIFNINYTMMFVYSSTIVSGGGWICYRGYDANTNTIGYQVRTNSGNRPASDTGYRYRLWFTSLDGTKWVPVNTSTSTDATTARTLNARVIDPFGPIVYNSTNGAVNSGARPAVTTLWQQYTLTIGYSYVVSLTAWKPVYVQCTPQTGGGAVMNAITQTLPTTADGKIYIFLGLAYSTSAMELNISHPVYYYADGAIRLWTNPASSGSSVDPATATPLMDGTGAVGTSAKYAREDHVHPSDTSRVPVVNSTASGSRTITTTVTNGGSSFGVETLTSFNSYRASLTHNTNAISLAEYDDDTGDYGQVSVRNYSVSIDATSDTSSSSIIVGQSGIQLNSDNVTSTTPASGDNSTKVATTAFVKTAISSKQDTLVSGTNIKTINGSSILGSGDLVVGGSVEALTAAEILSAVTAGWGAGAVPNANNTPY